jgi:diguanylate cyclase (GGDEF)-like protein
MKFDERVVRQILAATPRHAYFVVDASSTHRLCGGDRDLLADLGFGPHVEGMQLGFSLSNPESPWNANVVAAQQVMSGSTTGATTKINVGPREYECTIAPMLDDEGEIVGVVIAVRDVSHRKRNEDQLRLWARTDGLTGLANRNRFLLALQRPLKGEASIAVVYMDLDGFKALNDVRGHTEGDACLVAVAKALETSTRAGDLVARMGGDEFAVMLTSVGGPEAIAAVTSRFRAAVRALPYGVDLSIGVSVYPDDGADAATLIRKADEAMYREKRARRGSRVSSP